MTARRSRTRRRIRGGDLVAERRDVHLAQLGERERRRCEREARVRVRELAAQPSASEHDAAVVEGGGREVVDRMPPRVRRDVRVDAELDQPRYAVASSQAVGSRAGSL
jgi:hypothetical protein